MRKINYYERTSPIMVSAKNETIQSKQINLFGSEFNDFESKDIECSFSNISYSSIQKKLLYTNYKIDTARIILCTKNSKGKIDSKKSKENLDKLVVNLNCKEINGQECTIPLIVGSYIQPKQHQKNIVDISYPIELNGSTAFNFTLPPNTEVVISFFPYLMNELGNKTYYGERGMVEMVRNINHPFSEILISKINEAKDLINIYDSFYKIKEKKYYSFVRVIFNEKIDGLLFSINEIPADLYRNMVNLYLELDSYIIELKHQVASIKKHDKTDKNFSVDNFLSKLENEIGFKKQNKKSVIKKQPAKKSVKKATKKVSKK